MKGFSEEVIAPCGMNCGICLAYFGYMMSGKKRKMKCIGCNPSGKSCAYLKKFCEKLIEKKSITVINAKIFLVNIYKNLTKNIVKDLT